MKVLASLPRYCSVVNLQVSSSNYNEIFALIKAKVAYEEYMRIKCHNCLSEGRKCEAECGGANGNEVVKQAPQAPKRKEGNNADRWLIIAPSAAGVGILVTEVYCCARRLSSNKSKDDAIIVIFKELWIISTKKIQLFRS